jgi:hypothetical protein
MIHLLSISCSYTNPDGINVRGKITGVEAETTLDKPPLFPYPEQFKGRLIGIPSGGGHIELTSEQLDDFGSGRVDFIGKQYEFQRLDEDGTFEVCLSRLADSEAL